MLSESFIGDAQQIVIKARLSDSTLIPTLEQDGFAIWIESVGHAPCASIGIKSQFLHVRVARTLESICLRPSKLWSILAENNRRCLQLFANGLGQMTNFHRKFVVKFDRPLLTEGRLAVLRVELRCVHWVFS